MDSVFQTFLELINQDFSALMTPEKALLIYIIVSLLVFLESGLLPAAPLPCDSVVILTGMLMASGVLDPIIMGSLIVIAAALGSWVAYLQGKWLNKLPKVQRWIKKVPQKRLDQIDVLTTKHGLVALFSARFVAVARSLLPLMMGLRKNKIGKFQWFSWLSALLWMVILCGAGWLIHLLPDHLSKLVMMGLMAAPIITLVGASLSVIVVKIRSQKKVRKAA
ncbi:DedA family protein [Vibrio sp.]|nr:DedA family protein [Vibrio sp.]